MKDYKVILYQILVIFVATICWQLVSYIKNIPVFPIGYNEAETIKAIKQLPEYQKDSLYFDDQLKIHSSNGLLESVIYQMYIVEANKRALKQEANKQKIPEQILFYKAGVKYYLEQYGKKK